MEVDNIASEFNVQGRNNTISNGNRTVHNNFTINIENYHASPNDSQQPPAAQNPSLPTSLGSDMFEEGEGPGRTGRTNTEYRLGRLDLDLDLGLELAERLADSLITHKDVSWLRDKTVGGCQSSKRAELYEHLDIDDQEVENIRDGQQLQSKHSLEGEVYAILDHGLIGKKRTRRYLLKKLCTFDPYLAQSYVSFLAQVLLETLLEKLLTFQDVMWLTNKLVGGVCCNSVHSLYHLFDIKDQDIDRIRSHHVRKEDSFVDEVFMILDYGLRRQKKKRRYVVKKLLLLDEDLAHSFQEYLLSH